MASTAIQTVFCWSKESDVACVEFWRNEDYYVFSATPETLRQVLRLVGICAGDPKLNLTWEDAAQITAQLRAMVQVDTGWNLVEAEPEVVKEYLTTEVADLRYFGWMIVASCIFWGLVSCLVVMYFN